MVMPGDNVEHGRGADRADRDGEKACASPSARAAAPSARASWPPSSSEPAAAVDHRGMTRASGRRSGRPFPWMGPARRPEMAPGLDEGTARNGSLIFRVVSRVGRPHVRPARWEVCGPVGRPHGSGDEHGWDRRHGRRGGRAESRRLERGWHPGPARHRRHGRGRGEKGDGRAATDHPRVLVGLRRHGPLRGRRLVGPPPGLVGPRLAAVRTVPPPRHGLPGSVPVVPRGDALAGERDPPASGWCRPVRSPACGPRVPAPTATSSPTTVSWS